MCRWSETPGHFTGGLLLTSEHCAGGLEFLTTRNRGSYSPVMTVQVLNCLATSPVKTVQVAWNSWPPSRGWLLNCEHCAGGLERRTTSLGVGYSPMNTVQVAWNTRPLQEGLVTHLWKWCRWPGSLSHPHTGLVTHLWRLCRWPEMPGPPWGPWPACCSPPSAAPRAGRWTCPREELEQTYLIRFVHCNLKEWSHQTRFTWKLCALENA